MNGNDPMWFSRKDIFAVVAALVLGIIYILGVGTRDWIATALILTLTFWIISKLEQVYLTGADEAMGVQQELSPQLEDDRQERLQANAWHRLKLVFCRRPAMHVVMAICASLYILACFALHQEIILAVTVLTAISFNVAAHIRRRRGASLDHTSG